MINSSMPDYSVARPKPPKQKQVSDDGHIELLLPSVKKAYRKASLLLHPDKVSEQQKEEATRKFQVLSKVHYILSDPDRRKFYDETGGVDSENEQSEVFWEEYWRAMFPKITLKDIDNFFESYKGSDEEQKDLKECYLKYEGDMDLISEWFIGYHVDEEDRIRGIINQWIESEEVPAFRKFVSEKASKRLARQRKAKKEAAEREREPPSESLVSMIAKRNQERESSFNSMMASIEAKYGGKETKPRKKKKI